MPELPEVEVTRRGIAQRVEGARIDRAVLRTPALRYPIPAGLARNLAGRTLVEAKRRGKYLLLDFSSAITPASGHESSLKLRFDNGHLLIHLGMSGSLRFVVPGTPPEKHDHADFVFGKQVLRLTDPRRFGALLWLAGDPLAHPLIAKLGIEPLSRAFTPGWLQQALKGRSLAIKPALMDSGLVVGVGNIYAAESLFDAGIDPRTPAGRVSLKRLGRLVPAIQTTLRAAIRAGGSTLRDFRGTDGGMGDFQTRHKVYDRAGEPCLNCGSPIRAIRQGQRSSFYCPRCQR
ncbi:MAG: bifunctional DNA-formamidopyrimidine glycosylase/DNA-(apurinic or apyrimidinic site) lyase [Gammaproteobacteria bacterium]|nr:bifunctional DNA-formamidopyrimidine glycosylase/DNA-(apurinic or apyrimidinic site) lyase [Rhodocyclaceae bacterium]MBU3909158.1 bifunctional DNA-formamidopyrimidine glycosylase/DNA-(apurinic or apyrimidinic site) lyase [Gammaproteobacteria bacterium]MBU3988333.1 bifunctional DNA-formamidopyrimidine glycosylase/DNA-(apurinic or apyrimidinic site) lyase [Gammaproteobacteria bacterium]MBU4005682.1 bifunctional DNA-formamidopyrimidine glycosylase/DNA-(apurinic or apyrimidinic site) lyase [Gamma